MNPSWFKPTWHLPVRHPRRACFWTVCNACACKFTLNHANQVKFKVCRHRIYARIYLHRLPTERTVCMYLMLMPIWFYPSQSRFIFTTFFMIWSLFLSRGHNKLRWLHLLSHIVKNLSIETNASGGLVLIILKSDANLRATFPNCFWERALWLRQK